MAQPVRKLPEPNRQQPQRTPLIKPANDNKPQLPVQEQSQGGSMLGRWGSRIGGRVVPILGALSMAVKPTPTARDPLDRKKDQESPIRKGVLAVFKPTPIGKDPIEQRYEAQDRAKAEQQQAQEHLEQKAAIAKTRHDRETLQAKLEALQAKGQQEAARLEAQSSALANRERWGEAQKVGHEATRIRHTPNPNVVRSYCAPGVPTKNEVETDIKKQELLGRANDAVQDRFIDRDKSPFNSQQAQKNTAEVSKGTHETFTEGQIEKMKNDAQTLINKRLEGIENISPNQQMLLHHYYQAWAAKVNEVGIDKAYNKGTDILATKEVIKNQMSRAQEANRLGAKIAPSEQSVVSLVRDNSPYLLGDRCSFRGRELYAKDVAAEAAQRLKREEQEQRERQENSRFNTKEAEPISPPTPTIER
ncbi:MAG: hypothetical protein AAGC93_18430 [Cyanobacteria bacterium P01_F01_bin.53]